MPDVDDLNKDYAGTVLIASYTPKGGKQKTGPVYVGSFKPGGSVSLYELPDGKGIQAANFKAVQPFPVVGMHNTKAGAVYVQMAQTRQWRKAMCNKNVIAVDPVQGSGFDMQRLGADLFSLDYPEPDEAIKLISLGYAASVAISDKLAVAKLPTVSVPVLYHRTDVVGWIDGDIAALAPFAEHLAEVVGEVIKYEVRY